MVPAGELLMLLTITLIELFAYLEPIRGETVHTRRKQE